MAKQAENDANLSTNTFSMYDTFYNGLWNRFWSSLMKMVRVYEDTFIQIGPVYDKQKPYGLADPLPTARY